MRGQPGDGHYDIAKDVLGEHGVTAVNYADHCEQMFRLKFARIVEHREGILEVEHTAPLTSAQKRFIREKEHQGPGQARQDREAGSTDSFTVSAETPASGSQSQIGP